MSSLGALVFLVMGTTVYLLLFKRSYMIEENRRTPKVFMALVTTFAVFIVSVGYGLIPII